jgi:hypothetical protein
VVAWGSLRKYTWQSPLGRKKATPPPLSNWPVGFANTQRKSRNESERRLSVAERILNFLFKHAEVVQGGEVYLRRWFLFRSRRFSVYLHKICLPDKDADLHDHPWDFTTYCIKGRYADIGKDTIDVVMAGEKRVRKAEHAHIVVVDPKAPAWTLVCRGRYRRAWYYHTRDRGMVFWRTYLNNWGDDKFDLDGG